jgi:hypothetical protein
VVLLFTKEGFPGVTAASGAKTWRGGTAQVGRHEALSLSVVIIRIALNSEQVSDYPLGSLNYVEFLNVSCGTVFILHGHVLQRNLTAE